VFFVKTNKKQKKTKNKKMQSVLLLILIVILALVIVIVAAKNHYSVKPIVSGGDECNFLTHVTSLSKNAFQELQKKYPDIEFVHLRDIITERSTVSQVKNRLARMASQLQKQDRGCVIVGSNHTHTGKWIPINARNLIYVHIDTAMSVKNAIEHNPKASSDMIAGWINYALDAHIPYDEHGYILKNPHYAMLDLIWQCELFVFKKHLNTLPWKPTIVHVAGPQGVGKTTLAETAKKQLPDCTVIDSDDVYLERIKHVKQMHPEMFQNCIMNGSDEFWQKVFDDIEYVETWKQIVLQAAADHKHLVVFGITVDLQTLADHHYILKLDIEETYRRRCIREIRNLCDNRKAIEDMLAHMDLVDMFYAMYTKYNYRGVTMNLPINSFIYMNREIGWYTASGYALLPADRVMQELKRIKT
jgi:adenylate kinase/flagellar basal body-associated protein FliL